MQTPSSSSSGPPQLESGPSNSSSEDHDASLIVISEREFRELCPNGVGSEPIGPGTWVHNGVTIGPGKGGIFGHFGKGGNAGGKRGPRAKYDHAEYWAHSPIGPNLKPFCPDPIQAYYNLWHKLPPGVEKTPEELNQYRSSVPQPTWKKPYDFRIRGPLPPLGRNRGRHHRRHRRRHQLRPDQDRLAGALRPAREIQPAHPHRGRAWRPGPLRRPLDPSGLTRRRAVTTARICRVSNAKAAGAIRRFFRVCTAGPNGQGTGDRL